MNRQVRSWPLVDEHPAKSLLLVLLVLIVLALAAYAGDDILWALFAFFVLAISVAPYFFPTTYTLNEDGISVQRPWGGKRFLFAQFKSVRHSKDGLWLLPERTPGVYDSFRQLYVPIKNERLAREWANFIEQRLHGTNEEDEDKGTT